MWLLTEPLKAKWTACLAPHLGTSNHKLLPIDSLPVYWYWASVTFRTLSVAHTYTTWPLLYTVVYYLFIYFFMYAMLVNKFSFLIWVGRIVMQGFESACLSAQSFHVLPVALVIPATIKRHAYYSKCELLVCLISYQKVATVNFLAHLQLRRTNFMLIKRFVH